MLKRMDKKLNWHIFTLMLLFFKYFFLCLLVVVVVLFWGCFCVWGAPMKPKII